MIMNKKINNIFGVFVLIILQVCIVFANDLKQIRIVTTANVHGETDPCG